MFKFKNQNLISVAVFLLALFLLSSIIPVVRNPLLTIFKYPLTLFTLISNECKGIIFYHRNYIQNGNLKNEIDLLKRKLNDAGEVSLENQRLAKLLALKQEAPYKVIAARVIGRDASQWSSAVIVNKGSSSGIKKGFTCVSFFGLIGRVIEASDSVSKIMLINDPTMGVSAIVQRSREEGLVSGSLGGFLIMKYLPKDCDIQRADEVMTSGLTGNYPKGIPIGKVVDIGEEFSGLSRYAIIKSAVNLSTVEEVLIIIQ